MRSIIFSIAAMTALAFTGARADMASDAFKDICVQNHGAGAQALASADRMGWMPIPKPMLDQFPKSEFRDAKGRLRTSDDEFVMLVVGHGAPLFSPDIDIQICAIAVMPGRPGGFDAFAAELAGVEKDASFDKTAYIWREENGKHIKLDRSSPKLKSYIAGGTVSFLMTMSQDKLAMIMLAVPLNAPAKP